MSQFYIGVTAGSLPPTVPTRFITDINSPAIPLANDLNEIGGQVSTNNVFGIQTDGSSGSNTLTVQLTNRIIATPTPVITTTDAATTVKLYTFPLGSTAATYLFDIKVVAYNVTDNLSAAYQLYKVSKTDGITVTDISANPGIIAEEGAMSGVIVGSFFLLPNSVGVQVNGLAGKTIHWSVLTTYTVVS